MRAFETQLYSLAVSYAPAYGNYLDTNTIPHVYLMLYIFTSLFH